MQIAVVVRTVQIVRIYHLCEGGLDRKICPEDHRLASRGLRHFNHDYNDRPRDGLFYPTVTRIIDSPLFFFLF